MQKQVRKFERKFKKIGVLTANVNAKESKIRQPTQALLLLVTLLKVKNIANRANK